MYTAAFSFHIRGKILEFLLRCEGTVLSKSFILLFNIFFIYYLFQDKCVHEQESERSGLINNYTLYWQD